MKREARHDVSSAVAIFSLENRSASPRRSAETASHTSCLRLGGGWKIELQVVVFVDEEAGKSVCIHR